MSKIVYGLIGAGAWGKNYIKVLDSLPEVRLKSIAVRSMDSIARLGNDHRLTLDYYDIILDDEITHVVVATREQEHERIISSLLYYNKKVLCEKPLGLSTKKMIGIMNNDNFHLNICYQYSQSEYFKKLKSNIVPGNKITFCWELYQTNYPHDLNYFLRDAGVHFFDMVMELVGEDNFSFEYNKRVDSDMVELVIANKSFFGILVLMPNYFTKTNRIRLSVNEKDYFVETNNGKTVYRDDKGKESVYESPLTTLIKNNNKGINTARILGREIMIQETLGKIERMDHS